MGAVLLGLGCGAAHAQTEISPPFPSSRGVDGMTVTPDRAQVTIGETLELTAKVRLSGEGTGKVTWTATGPPGWTGSAGSVHDLAVPLKGKEREQDEGTSVSGTSVMYDPPYPAPPGVTLTATSVDDSKVNATVLITLIQPKPGVGPAMHVDGLSKVIQNPQ